MTACEPVLSIWNYIFQNLYVFLFLGLLDQDDQEYILLLAVVAALNTLSLALHAAAWLMVPH